jgi:hypothetical protein
MNAAQKAAVLAVRAGDVFKFDAGRYATVMRTIPGGCVELRISGEKNGKPSLSVGEMQVRVVREMQRVGRAEYQDGNYKPLDHAALANIGSAS